jgi:hypothetical protein
MKGSFISMLLLSSLISFSQIPKPGAYIYSYCDIEYNMCSATCKVVIKGSHITVYATKELAKTITGTREGDVLSKGLIIKHKSGRWIIGKSEKDKYTEEDEIFTTLDFQKKQYWRF